MEKFWLTTLGIFSFFIDLIAVLYCINEPYLKSILLYLSIILITLSVGIIICRRKYVESKQIGINMLFVSCILLVLVIISNILEKNRNDKYDKIIGNKLVLIPRDSTLIKKAEIYSDVSAQLELAAKYRSDTNAFHRNYKESEKWLLMALAQNSPEAFITMAESYLYGEGKKVNYNTAYNYYCKAYLAGERDKSVKMILALENERKVRVNPEVSFQVNEYVKNYNMLIDQVRRFKKKEKIDLLLIQNIAAKGICEAYQFLCEYYVLDKNMSKAKYWADLAIKAGFYDENMIMIAGADINLSENMKRDGQLISMAYYAQKQLKEHIFIAYQLSKKAYYDAKKIYDKSPSKDKISGFNTLEITRDVYNEVRDSLINVIMMEKCKFHK